MCHDWIGDWQRMPLSWSIPDAKFHCSCCSFGGVEITCPFLWAILCCHKSFMMKKKDFIYRSSRPELFCRKGVLRNFAKFTGENLYQIFFFNKVVVLRPATLLEKRFWHMCFPVNFTKLLRTPLFTEHLRWLILYITY